MTDLTLTERMDAARDFPNKTCPYSRHAQMIAEHLLKGEPYPMLQEEPAHCGEAIGATVASLWEARARIATLEALVGDMAEAIASEREACAKTAEAHLLVDWLQKDSLEVQGATRMREAIVKAIRARAALAKYREVMG